MRYNNWWVAYIQNYTFEYASPNARVRYVIANGEATPLEQISWPKVDLTTNLCVACSGQ